MPRIKSVERYFYALDYEKQIKSKLTRKQFAVYTYLLSISKWNPTAIEHHYYVYKNSFVIKEACALLGISHQTWKAALNKLIEERFIREITDGKGWQIYFPKEFAPLTTELIGFLLNFSSVINNSGNLVGIYATLYRYWSECRRNGDTCTITITTLLHLFDTKSSKENQLYYRLALAIFDSIGLMTIRQNIRTFQGQKYIEYEIVFANNNLNSKQRLAFAGPDNFKEVYEAISNSIERE